MRNLSFSSNTNFCGEKTQLFSYRKSNRVFKFWLEFGLILYLDRFFVCKILFRVLREFISLLSTKLKTTIFERLIIFGFTGGGGAPTEITSEASLPSGSEGDERERSNAQTTSEASPPSGSEGLHHTTISP